MNRLRKLFVLLAATIFVLAQQTHAAEVTTRYAVSLKSGEAAISALILTNLHARTYTDPNSPPTAPNRCSLAAKDVGVLWKVVVEGAAMPANEITLVDDTGKPFQHVCWNSSGTVYKLDANGKRSSGGPQTEFLAVGPESLRKVTLKVGAATTVVSIEK
jgi:hypothetical protein